MVPESRRTRRRSADNQLDRCKKLKKPKTISGGKTDVDQTCMDLSLSETFGSTRSISRPKNRISTATVDIFSSSDSEQYSDFEDEDEAENSQSSSEENDDEYEEEENDIHVSSSSINGHGEEQEEPSIGLRTRSRWNIVDTKLKFSNSIESPIVLDDDDNDNDNDVVHVDVAERCASDTHVDDNSDEEEKSDVDEEEEGDGDSDDDKEAKGDVDDDDKESGVRRLEKIGNEKVMNPRLLSADEIHRVLFNSIMEDENSVEVEKPHMKLEDVVTTSSLDVDSETSDTDKSEQSELETDSLYKMLDFCLACGDDNDAAHLDIEDGLLGTEKNQKQLCKEGKHYLIIDEEIGVICKSCGFVREEIKFVMPPFHENLFGESEKSNYYYTYGYRDAEGLPRFEDPNCEHQHYEEDATFDPTGTIWEIIPGLRRTLLPHQREAFEFLWKNVAGGTNLAELKTRNSKSNGGGCLISHAPGTGKTRLSIAFLETYMKLYTKSRPAIIAPASILLSWKKEFKKWKVGIPFLNMNEEELSNEEISMASSLFRIDCSRNLTLQGKRMIRLLFWRRHESVLAISYTLFSQLAGGENGMFRKRLLEWPNLLILDEGHIPRNDKSNMFKVLSDVKTNKRFILSGTPFQNNFRELHNIFCLVRPEFTKMWDKNPFNSSVTKADEDNIRELRAKMKPYSHCYDGYVVSAMVPGLYDNIIYLEPSENQSRLLKDSERKNNFKKSHLGVNVDMTLISVHPMLFYLKDRNPDFAQELKSGNWQLADGAKTRFLISLIKLSSVLKERVLVFSQYLDPLKFVKAVLESSEFGWREGREILVMSGKQDMETRKRDMDLFNKQGSEAKVMLASTKACSEGIELTGASRVVLLDVTWNPAVERQAISRAYRIGQQKVVYVYHLIMTDNDSNRHDTQTQKNKFSNYVFSSSNRNKGVVGPSKPDYEDIIIEQLLEEKVIKHAIQQKKSEHGVH